MTDFNQNQLIIFPSELSKRRYEKKIALKNGFCETSNFTTINILKRKILNTNLDDYKTMSSTKKLLLRYKAVELMYSKINEKSGLILLSKSSCSQILLELENEFSNLPLLVDDIISWMLGFPNSHRLYQMGLLYKYWNQLCVNESFIDNVSINKIILYTIKKDKNKWPLFLQKYNKIIFRDIRWLDPFNEQFIIYLSKQIDMSIQSALPLSHASDRSENLGQKVISEIPTSTWPAWSENLSDALVLGNNDILNNIDYTNFDFSYSADAYGEIEDLARRIIWYIEKNDCSFHNIAIIVPNLSLVDDIVPHVFKRFKLPYFFRRGRPVSSSPLVKSFISYLSFPLGKKRDHFIDLLNNPNLFFENREELIELYSLKKKNIDPSKISYFENTDYLSGLDILSILNERVLIPNPIDDHFNYSAIQELRKVLIDFDKNIFSLSQIIEYLIEALNNINVLPEKNSEHGVNIINFDDAVGIKYKFVCFSALNDGLFPSSQSNTKLLSNDDRFNLKTLLEKKGDVLPVLALANNDTLLEQESIRFLSSLGITSDQALFSYRAYNSNGEELSPSIFYKQLWNLVGWSGTKNIKLSEYNQWRINISQDNLLESFFNNQRKTNKNERKALPGESFCSFLPKEFVRTKDELIKSEIWSNSSYQLSDREKEFNNLFKKISVEKERSSYLLLEQNRSSIYNGHITNKDLLKDIDDWINNQKAFSPSALEDLMHNRYLFLLERILGIKSVELVEDLPSRKLIGNIIHKILNEIYLELKDESNYINLPSAWANNIDGRWVFSFDKKNKQSIKLLVLDINKSEEILNFTEIKSNQILDKIINSLSEYERSLLVMNNIWLLERKKIISSVLNVIDQDIMNSCRKKYYPVLFEFKFGPKTNINFSLVDIPMKGCVDRLDLCFDEDNNLSEIHVIDYKSKRQQSLNQNIERIKKAMDCQLIIYAFAAQQYLFGKINSLDYNIKTKIGFIEYENIKFSEQYRSEKYDLIPLSHPEMIDEFLDSLSSNYNYIKTGNFSIDPYYKRFTNYERILRNSSKPDIK